MKSVFLDKRNDDIRKCKTRLNGIHQNNAFETSFVVMKAMALVTV
jgi:hypothetical protein